MTIERNATHKPGCLCILCRSRRFRMLGGEDCAPSQVTLAVLKRNSSSEVWEYFLEVMGR